MGKLLKTLISIFLASHGLVHLWYVVLSQKLIDFQNNMGWTGKSWLLSRVFQENITNTISTLMFTVSSVVFVYSGVLFFLQKQSWEKTLLISTIISTLTIFLFWDGSIQMPVEKGLIGILINLILLIVLLA